MRLSYVDTCEQTKHSLNSPVRVWLILLMWVAKRLELEGLSKGDEDGNGRKVGRLCESIDARARSRI